MQKLLECIPICLDYLKTATIAKLSSNSLYKVTNLELYELILLKDLTIELQNDNAIKKQIKYKTMLKQINENMEDIIQYILDDKNILPEKLEILLKIKIAEFKKYLYLDFKEFIQENLSIIDNSDMEPNDKEKHKKILQSLSLKEFFKKLSTGEIIINL